MSKILKNIGMSVAILALVAACSRVPAGTVGIKYLLLGGAKGQDTEVLTPGRYWIGINEELYLFPIFSQNYVWTKDPAEGSLNDESISFQDRDGLEISVDVGITYHIEKEKVGVIFEKYRRGIDEITDTYLRNMVRDSFVKQASNLTAEDIYGSGKGKLINDVQNEVQAQVKDIGITIEKIYWIGSARLPPEVVQQINEKINAGQKAMTRRNEIEETKAAAEKEVAKAEGEKRAAILRAQGVAESNQIINESLNDELIRYKMLEKWDGVLPKVSGTGGIPLLDMKEMDNAGKNSNQ